MPEHLIKDFCTLFIDLLIIFERKCSHDFYFREEKSKVGNTAVEYQPRCKKHLSFSLWLSGGSP